MNHEAVYRTAPATPGLLTSCIEKLGLSDLLVEEVGSMESLDWDYEGILGQELPVHREAGGGAGGGGQTGSRWTNRVSQEWMANVSKYGRGGALL